MSDAKKLCTELLTGVATYVREFAKEALVKVIDKQVETRQPKLVKKTRVRKKTTPKKKQ
jgi:hypothetical protein